MKDKKNCRAMSSFRPILILTVSFVFILAGGVIAHEENEGGYGGFHAIRPLRNWVG